MSNLPTESEIYGKSKNDNDGIVLNIYNKPAQNNEESNENSEINQTEANLKLEDNYYNNLDNNPMALQNNKFTIYDNTRENPSPYPLSENRGIQYPAPPVQNQRNYYNSVNPNFVNDGKDKSIKFGNDHHQLLELPDLITDYRFHSYLHLSALYQADLRYLHL